MDKIFLRAYSQMLDDPGRLAVLKQNAQRLGKPQAAVAVARAALNWPANRPRGS